MSNRLFSREKPSCQTAQYIDNQNLIIEAQALIRNKSRSKFSYGTIGGYVKDMFGRVFGMTCLHVAKADITDWKQVKSDESKDIVGVKGMIGTINEMDFTEMLDIAFIEIQDMQDINNEFIGKPTEVLKPKPEYNKALEIVILSERQKKTVTGFLIEDNIPEAIKVTFSEGGKSSDFVGLMSFSTSIDPNIGTCLTKKGDSGAWIRTKEDNKVVGMVIGATPQKTYAIKMSTIFEVYDTYTLL